MGIDVVMLPSRNDVKKKLVLHNDVKRNLALHGQAE